MGQSSVKVQVGKFSGLKLRKNQPVQGPRQDFDSGGANSSLYHFHAKIAMLCEGTSMIFDKGLQHNK